MNSVTKASRSHPSLSPFLIQHVDDMAANRRYPSLDVETES
jgi:hypothetical protein